MLGNFIIKIQYTNISNLEFFMFLQISLGVEKQQVREALFLPHSPPGS